MDKKELELLAQTKRRFNDVMALRKLGKKDPSKYDEIFQNYGQKIYNIAVPKKHREAEIKQFMKEGRFEDIYRKHGSVAYERKLNQMQAMDVYNEMGSKPKSIINRVKNAFVRKIAPFFISTTLGLPAAGIAVIDITNKADWARNEIEYAEEIEKYDARIKEYAAEVNSMNLTHTQIFTKVMADMWEEIDGYGENTSDIAGFLRLSLQEDGQGVCRHFADDTTAKLNAVNPEYNARNLAVCADFDNGYRIADIDRTIIESNHTVVGNSEQEEQEENSKFSSMVLSGVTSTVGNHMVTVVDIPGENLSLVLDPTNPSIGAIIDGQIYMFSTPDGKGITAKPIGQIIMQGVENTVDFEMTLAKSFLYSDKSIEELREIYGIEAQNEALNYLDSLKKEKNYEALKSNDFDEKIKVSDEQVLHRIQRVSEKAVEESQLVSGNNTEHIERE